ncbi:UNVERIFIED_ORG: hypothetical protein LHK14_17685 [Roseateles sp. XES5]|nr:hypothetical protein [Roseateles sp. XES5]
MLLSANDLRAVFVALRSIDRHEILAAGYDMPDGSWQEFRDNPLRRFLHCNVRCRAAIMACIRRKLPAIDFEPEPTDELVRLAKTAFYNNSGDDTDDPMRFALRAVLAHLAGHPDPDAVYS